MDIRDRQGVLELMEQTKPAVIVHTAAQPSHDRAAQIAFDDFDTNAVGTLNLLEAARRWARESPRKQVWTYVDSNRVGDHICYYSDLTKMKNHYPEWGISKSLKQTVAKIASSWDARLKQS